MLGILITLAAVTVTVVVLRLVGRWNDRMGTLSSRRRAAVLQLATWFVVLIGLVVGLAQAMVMVGLSAATMAVIGAAGVSGLAFAFREPVADFLAATSFVIERAAAIGDEIELNGDVRGRLVGFGLRSVAVLTWDGDTVYHTASAIRTFRNISAGVSRAVVDVDIPATVRTARARTVLEVALSRVRDTTFHSEPEVLGVVAQYLDRYVMRVSCIVDPALHKEAEYRLKAAAADAVGELLRPGRESMSTAEMVAIVSEDQSELPGRGLAW